MILSSHNPFFSLLLIICEWKKQPYPCKDNNLMVSHF